MPTFLNSIKRRWRSRGFGIHSPFAYHFVTEVLCLPAVYGYYAYAVADTRQKRLLVRLLAYFNPATVAIDLAEDDPSLAALVRAVCRRAAVVEGEADFTITDRAPDRSCNALILGRRAVRSLDELRAEHGMVFSNGSDCAVVAALPHLPRQNFEIRL